MNFLLLFGVLLLLTRRLLTHTRIHNLTHV